MKNKSEIKNIKINYSETNVKAVFDMKWTSEALCNVLDNAIKYSNKNSIINVYVKDYEMFADIIVEDNGIGISENEIEKIFGRFYRGTNVLEDEGIGIGLYLAREIIEKQNGYIYVESIINRGSVFKICMPK